MGAHVLQQMIKRGVVDSHMCPEMKRVLKSVNLDDAVHEELEDTFILNLDVR